MNIREEFVKNIKKDCEILQSKMSKALEQDNYGTYNNLQKALINNIKAISEFDNEYKQMWTKYTENDKKYVAVWEQNQECDIKNHKVFEIKTDTIQGNLVTGQYNKVDFFTEWKNRFLEAEKSSDKKVFNVNDNMRNIGKTMYLIKRTIENDGIYVTNSKATESRMKEIAIKEFGKVLNTYVIKIEEKSIPKLNRKTYIDEDVNILDLDLSNNDYFAFSDIKRLVKSHKKFSKDALLIFPNGNAFYESKLESEEYGFVKIRCNERTDVFNINKYDDGCKFK